jgi:hypothetical protein
MRCPIEGQEGMERLLAYSRGRNDSGQAGALAQHVEACAACREVVEAQRAVWAGLNEWAAPDVSADFNRRLYNRIERDVPWLDRLIRPVRPLLVWRIVPVVAAAGLLVTVGIVLEQGRYVSSKPRNAPIEIAQPEQVVHAPDVTEMLPPQMEMLPPQQQSQIRQRLERLDSLPPQQRQRIIQQYRHFQSLRPETQRLVTRQIQALNHLPDDQRPMVRAELQRLRRMAEDERQARLASEEFREKFTPAAQTTLADISENLPLGGD